MSSSRQEKKKGQLVPLSVRLPPDVHAALVKIAAKDVRSLNSTIIIACRELIAATTRRR